MTPLSLFYFMCAFAAGLLVIGGAFLLAWAVMALILSAGWRGR